jgi:hypothetical protein
VADTTDPDLVAHEYASLDRLSNRRLDRTGWLRGVEDIGALLGAINRWRSDAFDGRNGAEALARHFISVERRDTSGEVLWENRAAGREALRGSPRYASR